MYLLLLFIIKKFLIEKPLKQFKKGLLFFFFLSSTPMVDDPKKSEKKYLKMN